MNLKCPDCGHTFYAHETGALAEYFLEDRRIIEDEDELRAAEEEVKKQNATTVKWWVKVIGGVAAGYVVGKNLK